MTRREAGRKGGLATLAKHGTAHYRRIGRLGAQALYSKYSLHAAGLSGWALISRETGEVRAIWS